MTSEQKGPHRSDRVRLGMILLGPVLTFVAYMIAPQDLPRQLSVLCWQQSGP